MRVISAQKTLVENLKENRRSAQNITLIKGVDEEIQFTISQLYDGALLWLGWLQKNGLKHGDKLVLFIDNNHTFIHLFWGCLLGGIIPVPVAHGSTPYRQDKLINIIEQLGNCKFYIESATLDRFNEHLSTPSYAGKSDAIRACALTLESTGSIVFPKYQPVREMPGTLDDIAFIQFSSGSTSRPKGVLLTHRNLITNIGDMYARAELEDDCVALSWIPLTHDMGLIGYHLLMVAGNVNHIIMDTSLFARRPLVWMHKISEKKATMLSAPNFGFKHFLNSFRNSSNVSFSLSHVTGLICGAEPISYQLVEEFVNALKCYGFSDTVIRPSYGLAEAGLAVSIASRGSLLKSISLDRNKLNIGDRVVEISNGENASVFTMLGRPLENCHVRIVDNAGIELNEKYVGEIEIKGENVTQGYYAYEDGHDVLTDNWFRTGDIGLLYDGELLVTGRKKEIIFVEGQNYYPHDLESILEAKGISKLGEVAVSVYRESEENSDKILVFIRNRSDLEGFVAKAREAKKVIFQTMGLDLFDVVPVRQIPKTTSGKVRRYALAESYREGEFSEVIKQLSVVIAQQSASELAHEDKNDLEANVLSHVRSILDNPEIALNDSLFELGASSTQLVLFGERLNLDYSDCIDVTDFYDCESISELVELIRSRISESEEGYALV